MRFWTVLFLFAAGLKGQTGGQPVQINPLPFFQPSVMFTYFDGSNRVEYICQSLSQATSIRLTVSGATAASPGVFTTADHGWYRVASGFDAAGYRPKLTITGGTGNWAAANGTWLAVPISATTFSLMGLDGVALNTTGFGAVTGTLTVQSQSPRLNDYHWYIRKFVYDGSGNNTSLLSGFGPLGWGRARCDQRTSDGLVEYR